MVFCIKDERKPTKSLEHYLKYQFTTFSLVSIQLDLIYVMRICINLDSLYFFYQTRSFVRIDKIYKMDGFSNICSIDGIYVIPQSHLDRIGKFV